MFTTPAIYVLGTRSQRNTPNIHLKFLQRLTSSIPQVWRLDKPLLPRLFCRYKMDRRQSKQCYFCQRPFAVQQIAMHMETCGEASTCQYCSGRVSMRLFAGHQAVCDQAPVKQARFTPDMSRVICLSCNREMPFPNLSDHLETHRNRLHGLAKFSFSKTCAICQEDYKEEEKLFALRCSHVFHCNCLNRWAVTEATCPFCRASIV